MASETSSSPTNRGSLASWWKNFKRKNPVVDSVHDDENYQMSREIQLDDATFIQPQQPQQQESWAQRPVLRYKSRSSNYIKPITLLTSPSPSFRAHRDSFLESQKQKNNNDSQVFGVPLEQSLKLASVNISISEDLAHDGIQYGAIPVVVGKCCVFLKKNGTEVEGIFRVGGASRRVKELQFLFSTPPDYGRRFDWEGYTVHDAASLLRRFLNSLPEPLIPLALYERFREPLRSRPHVRKFLTHKSSSKKDRKKDKTELDTTVDADATADVTGDLELDADKTIDTKVLLEDTTLDDIPPVETAPDSPVKVIVDTELDNELPPLSIAQDAALLEEKKKKKLAKVRKYKKLIGEIHDTLKDYSVLLNELRPASQHLLFYILDLLTVFATHSSKNLMSIKNLAAIFQPSILSHPDHDMSPEEYALSQQVIEFMLEYYRRLLEAAQKLQLVKIQEEKLQQQLPLLQLTTDGDSVKKSNESDVSVNTPVTPSSLQLHPPVSKRNSNRKHSKSLSSVIPPPDGLKFDKNKVEEDKPLLRHFNTNTDADDSEVEQMDKQVTPTTQMFPIDHNDQLLSPPMKPFSPMKQKSSEESFDNSTSNSLFHNFKRPLSVVFSNKEKNLSIEDIMDDNLTVDREGRWDSDKGSPRKENWFNRLRSRSRSSEPRNAQL